MSNKVMGYLFYSKMKFVVNFYDLSRKIINHQKITIKDVPCFKSNLRIFGITRYYR